MRSPRRRGGPPARRRTERVALTGGAAADVMAVGGARRGGEGDGTGAVRRARPRWYQDRGGAADRRRARGGAGRGSARAPAAAARWWPTPWSLPSSAGSAAASPPVVTGSRWNARCRRKPATAAAPSSAMRTDDRAGKIWKRKSAATTMRVGTTNLFFSRVR